ncbi:hypothetical protein HHK36_004610 [Tetracentron sinense]|uniref:peptidylprolyl isomerase n=1 Tax=Tetracentron sinense TaxID=13715 RepID=A0A834ZU00_TETSI|nr:hypothetical protein HHK36_004610 [Tetracentron sinense]
MRVIVQCNVGNWSPVFLCSLLPDKVETCPLEIEFDEENEVVFSVLGPGHVFLTGYFNNNNRRNQFNANNDDDTDSYGEDIAETESKESSYGDVEEDDSDSDDGFINDGDPGTLTPSPKPNSKTKGEAPIQLTPRFCLGRKKSGIASCRRLTKKYPVISTSEGNNDASQNQIFFKGGTHMVLDSDDEDNFPIGSLFNTKSSVEIAKEEEKSVEEPIKEGSDEKEVDDSNKITCSERKSHNVVLESASMEVDQRRDPQIPSNDVENGKSGIAKKKKKKRFEDEEKILQGGDDDQYQPTGDIKSDLYKENECQSKKKKTDNMIQGLAIVDELKEKLPNDNKKMIDSPPMKVNGKQKKCKEEGYLSNSNLPASNSASMEVDQRRDPQIPSNDVENGKSGIAKKKKKERFEDEEKILQGGDDDQYQPSGDIKSDLYMENECQSKKKKTDNMIQGLVIVDELKEKLPNDNKKMIDSPPMKVNGKQKKKKKCKEEGSLSNSNLPASNRYLDIDIDIVAAKNDTDVKREKDGQA